MQPKRDCAATELATAIEVARVNDQFIGNRAALRDDFASRRDNAASAE
jgi:hypothetical protein